MARAQEDFQRRASRDRNGNDVGEYADFRDLGASLQASWQKGSPTRVERGGYVFRLVLSDSVPTRERTWHCYAWPQKIEHKSRRAFVVDQSGRMLSCDNANSAYVGSKEPDDLAAFVPSSRIGDLPTLANDTLGMDGRLWSSMANTRSTRRGHFHATRNPDRVQLEHHEPTVRRSLR